MIDSISYLPTSRGYPNSMAVAKCPSMVVTANCRSEAISWTLIFFVWKRRYDSATVSLKSGKFSASWSLDHCIKCDKNRVSQGMKTDMVKSTLVTMPWMIRKHRDPVAATLIAGGWWPKLTRHQSWRQVLQAVCYIHKMPWCSRWILDRILKLSYRVNHGWTQDQPSSSVASWPYPQEWHYWRYARVEARAS